MLGLSLVSAEREQNAGAFSVDLVAEDEEGRTVVIENQLERSNHDHLGKLITYTAMTDAHVAARCLRGQSAVRAGKASGHSRSGSRCSCQARSAAGSAVAKSA